MKIIAYDDNPDFGGHQVMACRGIEALAADPSIEIECMVHPANTKLAERLRKSGIPVSPAQASLPKADLMLCIQGDIAQSTQGAKAARKAGIECIGYIALPHTRAAMGAKLGTLRDGFNQHLVHLPTRYIAISESMAALLRKRGARQRIDIVPNGIECPGAPFTPHASLVTLGLLGRIEFNQKRQDFMVKTFCDVPKAFQNCRLAIAGDGPDRNRLEQLISTCPRQNDIKLLDWQNDPEAFYSSIDLLAIPSRYEGVPLVMLEALARGIPVIGSNRDGMKDLLPAAWTFDPETAGSLVAALSRVRATWQNDLAPLREKILAEHSLDAFQRNFRAAVLG